MTEGWEKRKVGMRIAADAGHANTGQDHGTRKGQTADATISSIRSRGEDAAWSAATSTKRERQKRDGGIYTYDGKGQESLHEKIPGEGQEDEPLSDRGRMGAGYRHFKTGRPGDRGRGRTGKRWKAH